ncbi:MAG TPA: TIM barrel protein [Micromonosporaceae bacterium]|nr:TIM barrel protein [Micromonosporaceae bacterium]
MIRVAANLGFLFTELPWPDRPLAARDAGFAEVEFAWPADPELAAAAVDRAGVRVALLNMPAGDLAAGERGYGNDPRRQAEWRAALDRALRLAGRLGCATVNVLAGTWCAGVARDAQLDCLAGNLGWAARQAGAAGVGLVVEPVNSLDIPAYLLPRTGDVVALLDRVGAPGIGVQLDTYHCAQEGDDPVGWVGRLGHRLGHVQLADHPGRHEPGTGSLPVPAMLRALSEAGYAGAVGLEYHPTPGSDPGAVAAAVRVLGGA